MRDEPCFVIRPLPFFPAFFISLAFVLLFISPFALVIWWAW